MEKTDKPLTRDALISMQVIDAKGRLVGKVKDIAFAVGKTGISLSVENEDGEIQNIPWEDVQAASDFIIIKPVPQSTSQKQQQPVQTSSLSEEEKVFGPYEQQQQPVPVQNSHFVQQQSALLDSTIQRWYCYTKKYFSGLQRFLLREQEVNSTTHFAQHAINLLHGFHNTKDGTATTTKNTSKQHKPS